MKKILSLVLVLAMVLSSFSFAFAASDDLTGHENEVAVRRLISLGLVKGDTQGYRPDDTITRAEFAAMAVRALGKEKVAEISKGATVFTDVPAAHWASGYIKVASTLGLVNGYGNGQFGPTDQITYEQALAIIVRALGYEQPALDKGGYPIGHLVVADDLDLTDLADGVSGMPATRGLVFQVIDNALIVDMMVQVGYGDEAKYEVKEGKTLLGELGYKSVTNRVVGFDVDDSEITIENVKGAVEVPEGFDFEAVYGLKITAWLDGDELVIYEVKDTPKFDAAEYDDEEIYLYTEDDSYEIAAKATFYLDGKKVDADEFVYADYAKVVFDDEDEVVWAQGFTFDDFMVVEEVEDDVVYSYGDELDIDGYTVVKDGKTAEVEEGDILFFNEDEGYAVVYNNSEDGEIARVYSTEFKFEGAVYSFENVDVKYLDGDVVGGVDKGIIDAMMDEGSVEVYFNFAGDAILVVGDQGIADTDYFYGVVAADTAGYDTRGTLKFTFDVLNEEGDVAKYDLSASFADKYDNGKVDYEKVEDNDQIDSDVYDDWKDEIKEGEVVKVTVDEDGVVTKVEILSKDGFADSTNNNPAFKVDATYADGFKLQDSAVVFWSEAQSDVADYTVMTWADAADEFSKVEAADVYADNGRVVALVISSTDADSDTTDYTGLVTKVRELKSGDTWEITIEVNGTKETYLTDGDYDASGVVKNEIVTIKVGDKTNEISNVALEVGEDAEVEAISTSKKTITTVSESVYELVSEAVVYDTDFAKISLRDLEDGDSITVHFVNDSTERFVSYVLRTVVADGEDDDEEITKGKVTYINVDEGLIEVDNKVLELDSRVRLINADGTTLAIGPKEVAGELKIGDILDKITEKDGVVIEMKLK